MSIGNAISAVGVGASILGGKKAQKSADKAADRQFALTEAQVNVELDKFDIWKEYFLPTEKAVSEATGRLVPAYEAAQRDQYESAVEDRQEYEDYYRDMGRAAVEGAGPDYDWVTANAAADVDQAFEREAGIGRRTLEARGVDPSSGNWQAGLRRTGAGTRAAAINQAREGERNASFGRTMQVAQHGAGLRTGQVPNLTPQSANGMATPNLSGAASQYGSEADRQTGLMKDYARSAGKAAEGLSTASWDKFFGGGGADDFGVSSTASNSMTASGGGGFEFPTKLARGGLVRKKHYAGGGLIRGPGHGTSDDVPGSITGNGTREEVALSNGEYVVPAEQVEQIVRNWFHDTQGGLQRRMV